MKKLSNKSAIKRRITEFILFSFFNELKVKKDNIKFHLSRNNYQLRRILREDWETVMLNLYDLSSDETLFIDVGANIGIVSCLLSKRVKFGFAFEPVPSSFSKLVKNINLNSITNIIPFQMAASDSIDMKTCTNLKNALTNYILDEDTKEGKETAQRDGSVKSLSIRLDDLIKPYINKFEDNNILLKIDVEGHEDFVLKGASELLSLDMPIVICLEYETQDRLNSLSKLVQKYNLKKFIPPNGEDGKNAFFRNS